MPNTRKHKRQQRSPSGKTQSTRTAGNKLRRATRRATRRKEAETGTAERWRPTVTIGREKNRWIATATTSTVATSRKKSWLVKLLRWEEIPMRKIHLKGATHRAENPR